MSERDGFGPGVPSWVDNLAPEPRQLTEFYGPLFGWEFEGHGVMPGDPPGEYFVARLRDRDVAGIGSLPPSADTRPGWNTYIEVADVDRAAGEVAGAGGTVLAPPFDAPPAARIAVVADPGGAAFCIWEPRERTGAQLVNEPGAWSMSALNTPVPEAAAAFYRAVFGWETEAFRLGDIEVTLFRLSGYVGGEPEQPVARDVVATMLPMTGDGGADKGHWSVDFWIGDVDGAVAAAPDLGGAVVAPPYDLPGLRQAVLSDPEGASFSVTQIVIDQPA